MAQADWLVIWWARWVGELNDLRMLEALRRIVREDTSQQLQHSEYCQEIKQQIQKQTEKIQQIQEIATMLQLCQR